MESTVPSVIPDSCAMIPDLEISVEIPTEELFDKGE